MRSRGVVLSSATCPGLRARREKIAQAIGKVLLSRFRVGRSNIGRSSVGRSNAATTARKTRQRVCREEQHPGQNKKIAVGCPPPPSSVPPPLLLHPMDSIESAPRGSRNYERVPQLTEWTCTMTSSSGIGLAASCLLLPFSQSRVAQIHPACRTGSSSAATSAASPTRAPSLSMKAGISSSRTPWEANIATFAAGDAVPLRSFSLPLGSNVQSLAYGARTLFIDLPALGLGLFDRDSAGHLPRRLPRQRHLHDQDRRDVVK